MKEGPPATRPFSCSYAGLRVVSGGVGSELLPLAFRWSPATIDARESEEGDEMAVILINPFEVPEGIPDEDFLSGWERAANYMRDQPGFLSTRLHRAVTEDARFRFINVAEWESPQAFQAAVSSDEFREIAGRGSPGSPGLYEVVR